MRIITNDSNSVFMRLLMNMIIKLMLNKLQLMMVRDNCNLVCELEMYNDIHIFLIAIKLKRVVETNDQKGNLSNTSIIKTLCFTPD